MDTITVRAVQYGDTWGVESNGTPVAVGLPREWAQSMAREFQAEHDMEDEPCE